MIQTNKNVTISPSSALSNTFSCNPNEGVTLCFNGDTCVDIDVEPGVSVVVFSGVSDVIDRRATKGWLRLLCEAGYTSQD